MTNKQMDALANLQVAIQECTNSGMIVAAQGDDFPYAYKVDWAEHRTCIGEPVAVITFENNKRCVLDLEE